MLPKICVEEENGAGAPRDCQGNLLFLIFVVWM